MILSKMMSSMFCSMTLCQLCACFAACAMCLLTGIALQQLLPPRTSLAVGYAGDNLRWIRRGVHVDG